MKQNLVMVVVLVGFVLASGCMVKGKYSRAALAVDGTLAVTGAVVLADARGTECGKPEPGFPITGVGSLACEGSKGLLTAAGATMLVAGAAGFLATLAMNAKGESKKPKEANSGVDFTAYANSNNRDVDGCAKAVTAWRRESDPSAKRSRLEKMRPECRARLAMAD